MPHKLKKENQGPHAAQAQGGKWRYACRTSTRRQNVGTLAAQAQIGKIKVRWPLNPKGVYGGTLAAQVPGDQTITNTTGTILGLCVF